MIWTMLMLSLGIVIWWGIGLGVGVRIGRRNGREIAEIDRPEESRIFGDGDLTKGELALTAEEIEGIDEWNEE